MIKVGIVDFDTSHVVQFTRRMNHVDIEEDQWVEGAKVVAGYPGESRHSPESIQEHKEQLAKYGVEMVDDPDDLIGKVDAVCIESNEGTVHLQRARPFIEAGIPCYIDKPFTCGLEHARAIVSLVKKKGLPMFSASSLRYAPEIVAAESETGPILGATAYSPGKEHPANPGLFNYGIHAVEMLFTLLREGCREVSCTYTEGAEVVIGSWKDGRIGTIRATRAGSQSYGFTAWGENGVCQSTVSTKYIYRELVREIVRMFGTGESPVNPAVTIEIVAFVEAALKSREKNGAWILLPE